MIKVASSRGFLSSWAVENLTLRTRLLFSTVVSWPMMAIYLYVVHHPRIPPVELIMPGWVPFWPAMAPLYIVMLLITWLLPVAIRTGRYFFGCALANLLAYAFVMPWWIIAPTTLARPTSGHGTWTRIYDLFVAFDPPNNIMPCAHGMGPIVAVWFLCRERRELVWPLTTFLVLALPSVALVWQHRPIDILMGTGAAIVAIVIAEYFVRYYATTSANESIAVSN